MSYITNKFKKLGRKETYNHFFSTLRYSLHVITHPADGYWDLIHAKRGSYAAANFLVIMTLLVHVWKLRFTSFLFLDINWETDVNVLIEIASILLPLAIFCICNWACTTLFDGKGHLGDIYMGTAYALTPYVLIQIPLIIMSNFLERKKIKNGICLTSSHTEVAERQFRYPIEYGAPRLKRSTMTATGSVGVVLSHEGKIKITSATIGKSVNYGITDVNNMGAVMAPAAAQTLMEHLKNLKIEPNFYDLILTGDLGRTGSKLFLEVLKHNNINLTNYQDAGSMLFKEEHFANSGSSGPVTLPLVVFNKIIQSKKYKKILLLATGALHSPTLVNQHEEIPAISHALSLEVL